MNRRRLLIAVFAAAACLVFGVEALHWARHGTRDALAASYRACGPGRPGS